MDSLPGGVAAAGWIPFAIVFVLTLVFSALYIYYFRHKRESEGSSTLMAILALTVTLLTLFLLPVDVFLVSFMKTSNGTFKDWALNKTFRETAENSVMYTYYVLYSLVLAFAFLVLPLIYFFYEEKDDESPPSFGARLCSAVKYTSVFLLFAVVLLLLGAFIPLKQAPSNSTEWEKLDFLVNQLTNNKGEDALSFILNVLSVIGMLTMMVYTSSGLSIWPIEMIKGSRSASTEHANIISEHTEIQHRISAIREKYKRSSKNNAMSSRDTRDLAQLEESERLLSRQEGHLQQVKRSWASKCRPLVRPFQIALGIVGAALGFVLWLSLMLANIDKAMNSLGYTMGYVVPERTLPNPLDYVLVQSQVVFPVDYILYLGIVVFLIVCTVSGIQQLGIWFFCIRAYKIRVHRTRPQGLLMLCVTVMYTLLALNILIYSTSPQYTTYGSQHYWTNETNGTNVSQFKPCSMDAPIGDCIMTRASMVMLRFFYKAWLFGAFFYWATWVFLGVSVVAFFVVIIRKRQSSIAGLVEADDLEDSDDDDNLLRA